MGHLEPLVLDNRPYGRYLWSGPLSLWQAGPSILGRGMIRDEREYQILRVAVDYPGDNPLRNRTWSAPASCLLRTIETRRHDRQLAPGFNSEQDRVHPRGIRDP